MRKIDLEKLKSRRIADVHNALRRVERIRGLQANYLLIRWASAMTAVEVHSVWERFAEARLVAGLNHDASHFIADQKVKGVSHVSTGLAHFVVRGGRNFFDFRSYGELNAIGNRLLGPNNPFRKLSSGERQYLDCLAAIRNCIVHRSEYAQGQYGEQLKKVYGIKYPPAPDEFLNAIDHRPASLARGKERIKGLAAMVERAILAS